MNNRRDDFPLLKRHINGFPLIYFDNAATSLKPKQVISAISTHYETLGGNPGRGTHELAFETTKKIAQTRQLILRFLNADDSYTVLFTKNATEGFNLVAQSIGKDTGINAVVTTELEHHSNLVPWLQYAKEKKIIVVPVNQDGVLEEVKVEDTLKSEQGSDLLAITLASNVTGQTISFEKILPTARAKNDIVLVDATQAIGHKKIDLNDTPFDFLVASGHKMFGPEGIGFVVLKKLHLSRMIPLLYGGGAVQSVSTQSFKLLEDLERFEAGTPHSAGVSGLNAAITYIQEIGIDTIYACESELREYLIQKLTKLPKCRVLGESVTQGSPICSFVHETLHPHDIAEYLNEHGVAVRAGLHCAEPLHKALKVQGSTRLSLSIANTKEEIDYVISLLTACFQKYA